MTATQCWDGKLIAVIVAQKPETAKQPDRPESAIDSGCIDYVLPPKALPSPC